MTASITTTENLIEPSHLVHISIRRKQTDYKRVRSWLSVLFPRYTDGTLQVIHFCIFSPAYPDTGCQWGELCPDVAHLGTEPHRLMYEWICRLSFQSGGVKNTSGGQDELTLLKQILVCAESAQPRQFRCSYRRS